jgi:hypothetical protein
MNYSNPQETYDLGYRRARRHYGRLALLWFCAWCVTFAALLVQAVVT